MENKDIKDDIQFEIIYSKVYILDGLQGFMLTIRDMPESERKKEIEKLKNNTIAFLDNKLNGGKL